MTFALPAFAECAKAIFSPGPTLPLSVCTTGGVPTVNEPFMIVGCASQKNRYVPSVSVMFQLDSPVPSIEVAWSTPGPSRWKLCTSPWSTTCTLYDPGSR